jgi:N-acetylneuraminic acid mutarotase
MNYLIHCCGLLLLGSGTAAGQTWTTAETNVPCTARYESSMVVANRQILLMGGRGIHPVERFDLKRQAWESKAAPPLELHHFQAVTYQNEVWIVGAFTGKYPHETPVSTVYIFNPKKNTWREGPELPAHRRRGSGGVVVYNQKLYWVGGIRNGHWDGCVGWFDAYDPQTNQWATLPDAPHARDHVQAGVVGDKLYLMGGRRTHARTKKVVGSTEASIDVFDFQAQTWQTLSRAHELPTARADAPTLVADHSVVVLGGESITQKAAHREVEAFDTRTQTWHRLPDLNTGRHATGAVYWRGRIYVAAGAGNRGGDPVLNTIEWIDIK